MTTDGFQWVSFSQARKLARKTEKWVFEGLISSSITTIYGRSNVGKSYLVASLIRSLILDGEKFLGVAPNDPNKEWRPVILCTDPGTLTEYGEDKRLAWKLSDETELDVDLLQIGVTRSPERWADLTNAMLDRGRNFVVLDNLGGATGDTNDPLAIAVVMDALSAMGVPVVILHHESEKGYSRPGDPPMGHSSIVQKSRAWIQARISERKGFRGGNLALIVQANGLDQPVEIVAKPKEGPEWDILNRGPWGNGSGGKSVQKRKPEVYDRNAAIAEFIRANCPNESASEQAKQVAAKFENLSANYVRAKLLGKDGPVAKLL